MLAVKALLFVDRTTLEEGGESEKNLDGLCIQIISQVSSGSPSL